MFVHSFKKRKKTFHHWGRAISSHGLFSKHKQKKSSALETPLKPHLTQCIFLPVIFKCAISIHMGLETGYIYKNK